jgi:flagellar basal-body rod protein FlgC
MPVAFDDMLGALNISGTGMTAERLRMEVVANNIANASSTRTANGGPFRRQDVVFAAVLNHQLGLGGFRNNHFGGVQVQEIVDDPSPFNRVYSPGHPDADGEGFITMPNVSIPLEMVNLITATRAYEANLRVAQAFRQSAEQALGLARS